MFYTVRLPGECVPGRFRSAGRGTAGVAAQQGTPTAVQGRRRFSLCQQPPGGIPLHGIEPRNQGPPGKIPGFPDISITNQLLIGEIHARQWRSSFWKERNSVPGECAQVALPDAARSGAAAARPASRHASPRCRAFACGWPPALCVPPPCLPWLRLVSRTPVSPERDSFPAFSRRSSSTPAQGSMT